VGQASGEINPAHFHLKGLLPLFFIVLFGGFMAGLAIMLAFLGAFWILLNHDD
jgi:hypothetical protein